MAAAGLNSSPQLHSVQLEKREAAALAAEADPECRDEFDDFEIFGAPARQLLTAAFCAECCALAESPSPIHCLAYGFSVVLIDCTACTTSIHSYFASVYS
eukprot:3450403-Pleurochrysis_carterae.AAC.2